jgi:hypothetical protein
MVTDKTEEELWEEKCREIALSVTTVLLPLLVHDREEPIHCLSLIYKTS